MAAIEIKIVPVTSFEQNCSILMCLDSKRCALVDPGGDAEHVLGIVAETGYAVEKILLTHGHFDHIGAAGMLANKLGVPIEGPHRADDFLLNSVDDWCMRFGFPPAGEVKPARWLVQGDTVRVGHQELDVLHCPGHTPGHVVFFHREDQVAWVGDVLFHGSIGRTDFPRGDHDALLRSIRERLLPLGDDVQFIPGHGPTSTLGEERLNNPFIASERWR